MAKPVKRAVPGGSASSSSGRVTPKGTPPSTERPVSPNSRYTPPSGHQLNVPSPTWVPVLMFGLLGAGALAIVLNYLGVLPSAPTTWYLVLGLGLILGGIITATQYR
ncbi:MAG: cell division protein CrgA [Acidimicrobiales bacterium]